MSQDVVTVLPETPFKACIEMVRIHRVGAFQSWMWMAGSSAS